MAGFENDVGVMKNLNFDEAAAKPHLGIINAAGKFPIGSGATFPTAEILGGTITSPGGTVTIGYSSPNITVEVAGGAATTKFDVDAHTAPGTDPVVPNGSGVVVITGSSPVAGTTPVQTNSLAANTYTIQVQKSQAIASTDATKVGLANFDSAAFDVDANGFVQLNGGGIASTAFDVQANTAPGTDPVVPTAAGVVTVNGAAVANHSVVLETRSRAANAYNLEVQYATTAAATDATKSGVAHYNSAQFSVDANGFVSYTGSTTDLHTARFIVSAGGTADGANYTTIGAAITAAVAATGVQTVFIQPGTYTENLTLSANVNLVAYNADAQTPNVIILGKATATFAGTCSISGIQLKTNSDYVLEVTGASATVVNLYNCYLNGNNSSVIHCTNANANISVYYSNGDLKTTGIAYFIATGGGLNFSYCNLQNGGSSLTNSTLSAGSVNINYSNFKNAITTSSTAGIGVTNSAMQLGGGFNLTCLTIGGSGSNLVSYCDLQSGTASALSIGAGGTNYVLNNRIDSTNTNAITGAGSISYGNLIFTNTSSNINTTTQTLLSQGPSVTIGSSNSGNTNTLTVNNTSNTATSKAAIVANVAGSTADDAVYQATITSGQSWSWGLDNSASDAFVIASSATLGTTNVMSVATTGEINYPLQSAFMAYMNTAVTNVTGDSTVYTVIFDTEVFDQNSDFNLGTSTFTAPVTGRYKMSYSCGITGGTSINSSTCTMVTSNRNYTNPMPLGAGATTNCSGNINVLADFDAADTATFTVATNDTGGKIDDVNGLVSSNLRTWVSGALIC